MNHDQRGTVPFDEPKLWVEREEDIVRFDVLIHDGVRVGCTSYFLDYNLVPFKGGVGFVGW